MISELDLNPEEVMMIGGNQRSDYNNTIKSGLNAYLLPHKKYLRKNKLNNLGNDKKRLKAILNKVYKSCKKGNAIHIQNILYSTTFLKSACMRLPNKKISKTYFFFLVKASF